jgi:RsiW-degrading membrane proteinase PrsW (M82 family)
MTPLVLSALSTLCAGVPMVTFLAMVWWLDRYDREPIWLVVLTFLWGAMGGVVSAVVGSTVLQFLVAVGFGAIGAAAGFDAGPWIEASGPVLVAPAMEEPAKAAFLLYVIWNRHFDNMTDGFVYGAAAGLGFGMTENFLYFVGASGDVATWGFTVVVRTFYSALMHATATSIVGATLGFARFRGCFALVAAGGVGLGLAMTVHATWNGLLTLAGFVGGDWPVVLDYVLFPTELLGVLVVFELCVLDESFTIRRELDEEAAAGRIPEDHPRVLSSWFRRLFPHHLLPEGGNHALYVQTATSLAKRKRQVRLMGERVPDFYRDEVDRLRRQLEVLQGGAAGSGRR